MMATSLLLSSSCCGDFALQFPEIISHSKSAAGTVTSSVYGELDDVT